MRADRRNPLIAQLRRYKPTKFELTLRDGTKKNVPLSTKQNRWEQLDDLLEALPWVGIEAQDNEGNVLGAIDREGEADIEENDPDIARAEAFSRILLSAIATAMSETRKMFADTMKAQNEMARSMLESQHVVVESYQLALKVQQNVMLQAGGEGDDKFNEMLKMAMMMYAGGKPAITVAPPAPKPANPPKVVNGKPVATDKSL
jgi:hypothetical protein